MITPVWYMVLFLSIGAMSEKDSMAMVAVPFATQQSCKVAGDKAVSTFERGTKDAKFI